MNCVSRIPTQQQPSLRLKVSKNSSIISKLFFFSASFLKVCHRTDPKLNDCLKQSVENLKPFLKTGIPEFGIPSCEPLEIPEVILDQGTGAVSVRSTYTDIKVFGPSEFTLKSVK